MILSRRRRRRREGRGMQIDRRDLLTGLATSTVAAILPGFPATAIPSGVRRFYFLDGPIYTDLPPLPDGFGSAVLAALWHFDPNHGGPWLIRHVPTGLTCRRAPQEHDRLALQAVSIDAELAERADEVNRAGGASDRRACVPCSRLPTLARGRGLFPLPASSSALSLRPSAYRGRAAAVAGFIVRPASRQPDCASFRPDRLFPACHLNPPRPR